MFGHLEGLLVSGVLIHGCQDTLEQFQISSQALSAGYGRPDYWFVFNCECVYVFHCECVFVFHCECVYVTLTVAHVRRLLLTSEGCCSLLKVVADAKEPRDVHQSTMFLVV